MNALEIYANGDSLAFLWGGKPPQMYNAYVQVDRTVHVLGRNEGVKESFTPNVDAYVRLAPEQKEAI